MTGMEYLTPDGQQFTLDVTACVVGGGGFFCPSFESKFIIFRQSFQLIKCIPWGHIVTLCSHKCTKKEFKTTFKTCVLMRYRPHKDNMSNAHFRSSH